MRVYITKSWDRPDLLRQTPDSRGIWEDIQFTLDPVEECDYVIVLNRVPQPVTVCCPAEHVWLVMQEPPTEFQRARHRGIACSHRVFTQDTTLLGQRYVHSQPALPWHVNRDYGYLVKCGVPEKSKRVSWIVSSVTYLAGHRARLSFLRQIQGRVDFDLYGKGFREIRDKWDGLAPYRYSIVVENFRNPYYWTEKIADCFLAWTMPIYYGCSRIEEYFPAEAMVRIDIGDVRQAAERIEEAIAGDVWRRRLDAIAEARRLVLNTHQFFPFVTREIRAYEAASGSHPTRPEQITVSKRMRLWDACAVAASAFGWKQLSRLQRGLWCLTEGRRVWSDGRDRRTKGPAGARAQHGENDTRMPD